MINNKIAIAGNAARQLVRKDCNVYLKSLDQKLDEFEQNLCSFEQSPSGVYNMQVNRLDAHQSEGEVMNTTHQLDKSLQAWLVVRSVQNQSPEGVKLKENDIIKLGRIKIRVVEIREKKGQVDLSS